jgi:hypothetical protein
MSQLTFLRTLIFSGIIGVLSLNYCYCQTTISSVRSASGEVHPTLMEVGTMDGEMFMSPTEGAQLLYEGHTEAHKPVLAPPYDLPDEERPHITMEEFNQAAGTMEVEESVEGTLVTMELTGLIPGGVYTFWADFYSAPGFTEDFANELAIGALGPVDGSDNSVVASSDGTASVETMMPAGPTSWPIAEMGLPIGNFEVPSYALDAPVADFMVWGAYHIDGKQWGPRPGAGENAASADETWVAQFSVIASLPASMRSASADVVSTLMEVGTVIDGMFTAPTEGDQLLFEGHTEAHNPVLAPPYDLPDEQRHHVTMEEFNQASGTMQVEEAAEGSLVTMELSGLIPNGVYTFWADFYSAPGFTEDFANELAIGALGPMDGSGSSVVAASDGAASLETMMPAGPTSWPIAEMGLPIDDFEVPPYVLDAPVADFMVWGAYHIDGKQWGPRPGAGENAAAFDETWVVQFFSVAKNPDLIELKILSSGFTAGNYWVDVDSQASMMYLLESSNELTSLNWTVVQQTEGNGEKITLIDKSPSEEMKFYQVRSVPKDGN